MVIRISKRKHCPYGELTFNLEIKKIEDGLKCIGVTKIICNSEDNWCFFTIERIFLLLITKMSSINTSRAIINQ